MVKKKPESPDRAEARIYDFEWRGRPLDLEECFKNPHLLIEKLMRQYARESRQALHLISQLEEEIQQNPEDTGLLHRLANAVLEIAPGFAGFSYQDTKEWAYHIFLRIIQLDPRNADAYVNLGSIYHENGEYGKAERCFLNALAFEPSSVTAFNELQSFYEETGQLEKADQLARQKKKELPG